MPFPTSRPTNEPSTEPWVEIIEQPSSKSTRFRYESENAQGGILVGTSSTKQKPTFPAIKVHNHTGACVIVVSLVTTDEPKARPHPHALVGTDCKQEVCTKKVKSNLDNIVFNGLGIQCKKKNQIEAALTLRKQIRVDPFRTGFDHMTKPKINDIDLSRVKLCFQVFLPDKSGKYQIPLPPVCSDTILDKKGVTELQINDYLPTSCPTTGNEYMILLTGKLPKDDFEVMFYEGKYEQPIWSDFGTFQSKDVHLGVAVKVKIPEYTNRGNQREKKYCNIVLRRKSNRSEVSERRKFFYYKPDLLSADRPRKRTTDGLSREDAKKSRYEQDDTEGEDDGLPATVLDANLTSGSSSFHSGDNMSGGYSQYPNGAGGYTPQMQPNLQPVVEYSQPGNTPITGQDQWIPVRASDIQFVKNEQGNYVAKPGPTAYNQAAPERDLTEFNIDADMMEKLILEARANPDSEVYLPSNMSDILNGFISQVENAAPTNEVLIHSSGESNSFTKELRDIAHPLSLTGYTQQNN